MDSLLKGGFKRILVNLVDFAGLLLGRVAGLLHPSGRLACCRLHPSGRLACWYDLFLTWSCTPLEVRCSVDNLDSNPLLIAIMAR